MNKKVFCEVCRNDVGYLLEEKEMIGRIRGEEYCYIGKEAKCEQCGAYVDVEDISEYNLKALYDVYRKENGIISLEKIQEIPEKYDIGKRPLSILLGWGEHTFTRYCDGDIPTRQYSDTLNRVFDDPNFYLIILEENKKRLSSELTYQKSKKAVEKLISEETNFSEKINNAICYILNQCEDITPLALQKSLYYVQGFFFAFFERFIFEEDCQAWAHGPVYKNIYYRYANYRFDPISKVENFDSTVFSSQEKAVLDSVIKNLCCFSGKILEAFTHSEAPWLVTRGELPDGAPSNKVIDKDLIGEYFTKIKIRYGMNSPRDIQLYARDMFDNL